MPLQSIASGSNGSPALGRWLSHRHPRRAENPQGARGRADNFGAFPCRAAAVASTVNAPGQRPQPRCPWVVAMSGAFGSTCACRQPVYRAHADAFRALHAGDAGGQFGRQQPVVDRRDRRLADGGHADDDGRRPETAGVCVAAPRLEPVRGCDAHHRTEADLSFPIRRWNVRSVRVADDLLGTGKTPLQSRTSWPSVQTARGGATRRLALPAHRHSHASMICAINAVPSACGGVPH